jgi:ribonuclease R
VSPRPRAASRPPSNRRRPRAARTADGPEKAAPGVGGQAGAAPKGPPAGARGGASTTHVGVLTKHGKFLVAEPLFDAGPRLVVSRDGHTRVGDLVVVRTRPHRNGRGGRAVITRRLGRPEVARGVIEAFMIERGLKRSFDPAIEREAAAAAPASEAGRRDLRSLPTLTIDPVSARDFDDAISAEPEQDGGWRVWIHIADVSAYVSTGSVLDHESYRRGCSVYVPGAVEPMLPAALSSDACSLVPYQDRLAVTVELSIQAMGVRRASFYRSVIRSDARLDYDQVDRIFTGVEPVSDPWGSPLAAARAAAAALQQARVSAGALAIEGEEPEFFFDEDGHVVDAAPVAQTESHRLIEHLMIAANEQVARFLSERRIPTLYRVHERPTGAAVERLFDQLASLDVPTPPLPKSPLTPEQAARAVGEASQLIEKFQSLLLRSLKQAYYDHRNLGHAGLRSASYCHFTSPIRRYPDLVCHRALLSAIAGEPAPDAAAVAAAGPWVSAREREAMAIERGADDIASCFLLERFLNENGREAIFEGEVVGLHSSGAFLAFGERGQFEGMLPVRRLRGDWWELNEQETMLRGARSGRVIRLGDRLEVEVGTIDAPRGRVDLHPVAGSERI